MFVRDILFPNEIPERKNGLPINMANSARLRFSKTLFFYEILYAYVGLGLATIRHNFGQSVKKKKTQPL